MASLWNLETLTEFDVRMHKHAAEGATYTPGLLEAAPDKSGRLYQWLLQTRETKDEALRLSRVAVHSEQLLQVSLWIFSLLTGASAAAALLRYEGDRLINISAYLGFLVGGQLLLLCGLALGFLFFRQRIRRLQAAFMPRLIQSLASPSSLKAWSWRIFQTFQQAGIAFNLGILFLTLWKVLTYDLAFGWASTLQTDGQSIHHLVQVLSFPWAGKFTPSPEQIEQSRIALNAGLSQIDSASTTAWWPFLMMCVATYGLLPRILLSVFGSLKLRQAFRHPDFSSPDCQSFYATLTRAPLSFSSADSPVEEVQSPAKQPLNARTPRSPLRLELPPDLLDPSQTKSLSTSIQQRLDVELSDTANGILKVVEVWQPPLEETLRELRDLRKQLGPESDLLLLAVGFPDERTDHIFHPPEAQDLQIWQNRLAELRDPELGIIAWRDQ